MNRLPRLYVLLGLVMATGLGLSIFTMPIQAQICVDSTGSLGSATVLPGANPLPRGVNCLGAFRCYSPDLEGPTYETLGGCDPTQSTCTARAFFDLEFPGNSQNPFAGDSWAKLFFKTASAQDQRSHRGTRPPILTTLVVGHGSPATAGIGPGADSGPLFVESCPTTATSPR